MRNCKKCNTEKPLTEFYNKDYYCKECRKEYRREYDKRNRAKLTKKHNEYAKNNREVINKAQRAWAKKNPNYHNEYYKNVRSKK